MRKILVVTQAVDRDASALGFFVEWLRELARQCDEVQVIAFKVGQYELPANVHVHPVRVEVGDGPLRRLFRYWSLLRQLLPQVDGIFTHMSPEYLIAAAPLVLISGKPSIQWYAHRSVTWRLRLAEKLANRILTIAPGSFRLRSDKVKVVGHGIPLDLFTPGSLKHEPKLLSVGRITRIKRLEIMFEALAILRRGGTPATLTLVGDEVTSDDCIYHQELEALSNRLGLTEAVVWAGKVSYVGLPVIYQSHALHLNLAPTGALDKAVLEAMASGVPVIVANQAFAETLGSDAGRLIVEPTAEAVATRVTEILKMANLELSGRLRRAVEERHSLQHLVRGILTTI